MAYCGPRGIPHSHFLGGPARWTDIDREKALHWQDLEHATCQGCGTRSEEWDPAAGGDRRAYTFEPVVCPGCEQKERVQASLDHPDWQGQRGLQLRARRTTQHRPTPPT
jgi:hypothetical protein